MKKKPIPERIPDAMAPWLRIVSCMPLDQLWTQHGITRHVRGAALGVAEVEARLRASQDYELVEARTGSQLRWYPRGHYGFWQEKARRHAEEPDEEPDEVRPLDDFPDSRCYFISEWHDAETGDSVLLFEEHH
jgi:hypothetical protein